MRDLEGPEHWTHAGSTLLDSAKPMFFKEMGGVKWRTLAIIGVSAVAGAYLLPVMGVAAAMPVVAAGLGALGGLMGAQVLDKVSPQAETPPPTPATASPADHPMYDAQLDAPAPGATPGGPAPKAKKGR